MLRKLFILIILVTGLKGSVSAQTDLQFSQYMFNYLYINPAYAGYKEQVNATTFFRAQYLGFKGAPTTASVSVDAPVFSDNMGLGLQVNSDQIGIQNTLTANFAYSYRVAVGEDARLCFGLMGGISQFTSDPSRSNPYDGGDAVITRGAYSNLDFTTKAGLFYYNSNFYVGASASNMFTKNIHSSGLGIAVPDMEKHYYLSGGALVQLTDELALKPSFLLKDPQAGISTADINCFLLIDSKLWIGGSYRMGVPINTQAINRGSATNQNAAVFLAEFYVNDRLRIGYAYDYPLNNVMTFKSGSHEISIGYYLPISRQSFKNSMVTPRYF